ncbi:TlpA family protein disulfide reductase [Olivibacter sp. SDN3]|uniref:peroxiredoxin family protein n=1 Tax=Olivibacter sp. SDN3 TaxID=2764720 RepID=UPI00165180B3|nr:TlpA disulfide reductase family protein [Olivibacter sp. SDN3]QNL51430.1 TlpA family protein disulfide reductase [Olivibacter sp. SDN3]
MNIYGRLVVLGILTLASFTNCSKHAIGLKNGVWRGVLTTDSSIDIPFNFEIYDSLGVAQLAFLNGKERLNINEVEETDDSVFIKTPLYESEIRAAKSANGMEGVWIKRLPGGSTQMPFKAVADKEYRFIEQTTAEETIDVAGRWSVQFYRNNNVDTTFAVGEFEQGDGQVDGSFLTTTGDYRFLSGVVDKKTLMLSGFSGSGPVLFTGDLLDSLNIVNGKMYAGPSSEVNWSARRDPDAMLPDAYKIAGLKAGNDRIDFSFEDLDGQTVSLNDGRFLNKVVVVQFLGSWCPNCMDETAFLAPFYDKYKEKGLEVVGLAYERYKEPEKARAAVTNLKNRFRVNYPLLITGYTNDKKQVEESIPSLENFSAFPTTIIIDRTGVVRKIHTGFSGPATGVHYTNYIEQFEKEINSLLAQ